MICVNKNFDDVLGYSINNPIIYNVLVLNCLHTGSADPSLLFDCTLDHVQNSIYLLFWKLIDQ